MRTLESQREADHAWMLKVSHYVENMSKEAEPKAEQSNMKLCEMDRDLKELTANGLRLRQELSAVKSGFKDLETNIGQKLAGTVDSGISAALERVVSSTQSSFLTLEGMLANAFEELKAGRAGDGQVIQNAFAQAANELTAVKGLLAGAPTAPHGRTVAFTRSMCDQMVKVDQGVAKPFAENEGNKLGQSILTNRLDCISKLVGEQQAVAIIHGTEIESMSLTQFGCGTCGVIGATGVHSDGGRRQKPIGMLPARQGAATTQLGNLRIR